MVISFPDMVFPFPVLLAFHPQKHPFFMPPKPPQMSKMHSGWVEVVFHARQNPMLFAHTYMISIDVFHDVFPRRKTHPRISGITHGHSLVQRAAPKL
jgi:hypothetical protein